MCAILLLLLLAPCARADDWPQWRGPNRDGLPRGAAITTQWPLKVLWRKGGIGKSTSGIVAADGILVLHYRRGEQEVVRGFDAATGNDLWKHAYDQPLPPKMGRGYGNWPRSTPAIADGMVYTLGYAGKLHCTELKTGKVVWSKDMFVDFKHDKANVKSLNFGVTSSPLVMDGKVFIPQGTWAKWLMIACDAKTGDVVWKAMENRAPRYSSCYPSPIGFNLEGRRLVFFIFGGKGTFFSPASGEIVGTFPQRGGTASPVQSGDMLLQVHGPANAQTKPIGGVHRIAMTGGKPAATPLWQSTVLGVTDCTPVVHEGHIYGQIRQRGKGLKCVELATGKEKWNQEQGIHPAYCSVILVGDKLLMLMHNGELVLAEATPEGYREWARTKMLGATYSHPAISDGRLYLRDDRELVCLDLMGK